MLKLTFAGRGGGLAALAVAALLAVPSWIGPSVEAAAARLAPLVVRTDAGAVRGMVTDGAREFLGIPYAAPPVGSLRWQPPQPVQPWRGIRDATTFGSACAQPGGILSGDPAASDTENCLYLNVYTPATASARQLPVMVWIYGGAFLGGAGSLYDASALAARENVIVVTINYRVGVFGFLALPSLDAEAAPDSSGDYGLMDQQAALRWVQRDAAAFGGNSGDVTIFGESAGAGSVCDNMASPTAAGLFARAVAESGCLLSMPSRQTAEERGAALAANLGCPDAATAAACLRAKPTAELVAAEGTGLAALTAWGPVPGGPILPDPPATAFAAGRYLHVPLLQGTNADEGRFFAAFAFDATGHPLTAAQYPAAVQAEFGASAAPQILARYPLSAYPSPDLAFASALTDGGFSCPALQADDLLSASGVYGYEFDDPNPPNDFGITFTFPLGAAHGTEMQYVFQKIPGVGLPSLAGTTPPFTPAQFALSDQMMAYWARFAATGDPNASGSPFWPAFTPAQHQLQELTPTGIASQAGFGAEHQCSFWDGTGILP